MKIALFGSTGHIGSRVLAEATSRGHEVVAVVRDLSRAPDGAASAVLGDVTDADSVAEAVAGVDAVISAIGGAGPDGRPAVIAAAHALIAGLPRAAVERLLVVGGAGSLLLPSGVRIYDQPEFPEAVRPQSKAQGQALDIYKASGDRIVWTYLSPADEIGPGERTGEFALGSDHAVFDGHGRSHISTEDYALALIDELEEPRHIHQRFTLGYAPSEG